MSTLINPAEALYTGEKSFPIIPACEHFAGSAKLIAKALALQAHQNAPTFDITCDLEDGAAAGMEQDHAEMVARAIASPDNRFGHVGVRIHDPEHPHWRRDIAIILDGCGGRVAYITIPKVTSAGQCGEVIAEIQGACASRGIRRKIPIHVLIETHGALADVRAIAALPWMQVLDFGQMDFVSAHHGAIPASAMRSPYQFEHRLIVRAKAEIAAAALAHGLVPAHSVCLELRDAGVVYADALRARQDFGFLRMWSIHPIQIDAIVRAMAPDFSEVADAAVILLAAQAVSWGPIQYQGELHDRATYRYYWQVLQRAAVTGVAIPEDARAAFGLAASA